MCGQQKVAGTEYWRAQQVLMEMYAGTKAAREEAAVVMAAAGYPGSDASPLLRVKVLSSGAEHLVSAAMLKALPQRAFLPGEPVRRAMWSGAEEDAEVVRVDSAKHVTIRLKSNGVTYTSDAFRLRHMTPVLGTPAPAEAAVEVVKATAKAAKSDAASSLAINGKPLEALQALVAAKYPTLREVRVNPAATRGSAMFKRFEAAMRETAAARRVDFLLHGTPEHNVDSVLASGLRGRPGCNTRWLTSCPNTASLYARGAGRIVVCAVLVCPQQAASGGNIFTITDDAHHVPLFVARRC